MIALNLFKQLSLTKLLPKNNTTPYFCSDKCSRGSWLLANGGLDFNIPSNIINVIDSNKYLFKKFISDSESLGVIFSNKDGGVIKVGAGHIDLRYDAIISSGWPDKKGSMLLFFHTPTNNNFSEIRENGLTSFDIARANVCMAFTQTPSALFVFFNKSTGSYLFFVVDYNYSLAKTSWEKSIAGVSSETIPQHLEVKDKKINKECERCPIAGFCLAPVIPVPTCRNCNNSRVSSDGSVYCAPQNNLKLNDEYILNKGKCGHHIYNPDILSVWAEKKEHGASGGIKYHNMLNNSDFINGNSKGEYSSYQINSISGKNPATLVGDKNIEKIKEMFGADLNG